MHDPVKHIKYLRQALSQDKKQIGFFISAGCPLAVSMPKGKWPLIPDVKNLTVKVNDALKSKTKTPNNYDKLLEEVEKSDRNKENIEDILSFIRGLSFVSVGGTVRGFTAKDLEELEESVCKEIVMLLNVSLPDKSSPYHNLANWINSIEREKPIEVFTTNYDLLMEQAFEDIAVPYFDGYVGARYPFFDLRAVEDGLIPKHWTRLWKIHGSINWLQNKSKEVYRSSYSDSYNGAFLIYPSHLKYDQSRKMPYLALTDQLNKFIRQPSSLIIFCGYSFNDEHLNNAVVNALRSNPTATAIAMMFDTAKHDVGGGVIKERYENAFSIAKRRSNLSIWCFDEAVIGTLQGPWKANEPIEPHENIGDCIKSITKTTGTGPAATTVTEYSLQLGNFEAMGKFLQALIGLNQNSDVSR